MLVWEGVVLHQQATLNDACYILLNAEKERLSCGKKETHYLMLFQSCEHILSRIHTTKAGPKF